ncbi:MAG: DHA2 family efflux MFS transporter permease subunit [Betaproteobacteria bacterium]|nr:DHA2 family efflux MFS transporter permease subunit [Betaproteobacteria bacterium]
MFEQAPRHPVLVTASVILASLLYSIDWTIAAVALPHMQGTFSASQDQIGWVITSYIVASAISMPTAGFLSARFGRKRLFIFALIGFTTASVFCGSAQSLAVEVAARIVQGMSGAFLIPLSQAIILDTYPPHEHGKAMALWGTGSVFGSFLGPCLGGYLTEYFRWQYIFYINVPIGMLALIGLTIFVPETQRDRTHRLDWFGFVSLALGIGALQLMLDRGGTLDWFESGEIILEGCLSVLGFYLFLVHSLTTRKPFLDLSIITDRRFALGLGFVFIYGLVTVPPLILMPPFLAEIRGYSIDAVGLLQAPRGLGMLSAMIIGGRITGRIDPRKIIAFGLVCMAIPAVEMSTWTVDVPVWPLIWTNFMQGIGGGIILVPIQVIAFPGITPERRTEAAGVYNLVRSIGASIGVSAALAMLVRSTGQSRAHLTEFVSPYNEILRYAAPRAEWKLGTLPGIAHMDKVIDQQALMIAYIGDFQLLAVAALSALPLLLLVGSTPRHVEIPMEATEAA